MKRAEEMMRLMETVESQQQASHSFPQPLGNLAKNARFPHSLSSDYGDCEWTTKTQLLAPKFRLPRYSQGQNHNTYYRCSPHPWVTFLSDPTDIRLGYLVK
jgi:hypothetical protein